MEEIKIHPYVDDPILLLHDYDLRPLLDTRRAGTSEIQAIREFETVIQYGGWTCQVSFGFQYTKLKGYELFDVRLLPTAKAPKPHEQYEI